MVKWQRYYVYICMSIFAFFLMKFFLYFFFFFYNLRVYLGLSLSAELLSLLLVLGN